MSEYHNVYEKIHYMDLTINVKNYYKNLNWFRII